MPNWIAEIRHRYGCCGAQDGPDPLTAPGQFHKSHGTRYGRHPRGDRRLRGVAGRGPATPRYRRAARFIRPTADPFTELMPPLRRPACAYSAASSVRYGDSVGRLAIRMSGPPGRFSDRIGQDRRGCAPVHHSGHITPGPGDQSGLRRMAARDFPPGMSSLRTPSAKFRSSNMRSSERFRPVAGSPPGVQAAPCAA